MKMIFEKCGGAAESFWNSRCYTPLLLILASVGHITKLNLPCMFLLVAVTVFMLIFSDDLMSVICPLFMILLESIRYYKDYSQLAPYMWYAIIPFAAAALFNLIYYRKPWKRGHFTLPLAAVSIALLLGGVGYISAKDWSSAVSLYYMLGLGAAALYIYQLSLSRLENVRSYDRVQRLAEAIYAAGLLCVVIVIVFYARNIDAIIKNGGVIFFKARNYLSSVLLIAIPMPCLFIKRSNWHIAGMASMLAAAVTVGSRSGLLFAPIVCAVSALYIFIKHPEHRKLYTVLALIVLIPAAAVAIAILPDLFASRIAEGGGFISGNETRVKFIRQGIQDFLNHPINGVGVGNTKNVELFPGIITGSLVFYHNIVIQVFASMGLIGAAAYGWNFAARLKMLWVNRRSELFVFAFSYFGILLMSLTNPGMFCPFPEVGLFAIIFALIEKESEKPGVRQKSS